MVESKDIFVKLDERSRFVVYYFWIRLSYKCAMFKTMFIPIHLIIDNKGEVTLWLFKYKIFQKYYDAVL